MRNVSIEMLDALTGARDHGVVPRQFVWVTAKNRETGQPESLGVWSGDEDVTITVTSGSTGLPTERLYYAAGTLLSVGAIPRVSDLTIQTVTIDLSQIATAAQQMVRGYDVRLAKVEVHEVTLDTVSRLPTSYPVPVFLGEVDTDPINTPAAGADGSIVLNCVSDAISMLSRVNPRKSSYEAQKRRSGDEWGLYANTVATWKVAWGQAST